MGALQWERRVLPHRAAAGRTAGALRACSGDEMKHNGKAARNQGLSASASEFQPALEAGVSATVAAHPGRTGGAHGRSASGGAALDGYTGRAAPHGCPDDAYGLGAEDGDDGLTECGGANSLADELQSEDGRSDRVRLGSAARR